MSKALNELLHLIVGKLPHHSEGARDEVHDAVDLAVPVTEESDATEDTTAAAAAVDPLAKDPAE